MLSTGAIYMENGIKNSIFFILYRLKKNHTGSIAEKRTSITIIIIKDGAHFICSYNEHFFCSAGLYESSACFKPKQKTGTGTGKIESPAIFRSQLILKYTCR